MYTTNYILARMTPVCVFYKLFLVESSSIKNKKLSFGNRSRVNCGGQQNDPRRLLNVIRNVTAL